MGRPGSNVIANILRKHQIRVFRAETSIADQARRRVVSGVRVGLVRLLNDGDPTGVKRTPYRRDRVEAVAAAGRTQLRREFASIDRSIDREIEDMGELDGQVIARAINAVDGDLAVSVLSPKQLSAAVESAVIDGAPSGDWWKQQADEITGKFRREMLAGTEAGESNGQMIDRVRGFAPTREGVGGILTKRKLADIEALVRTSTMTTLNEIRQGHFAKNADVIRGMQWLSTFDRRVCPQCAALGGSAWEMAGLNRTPPVFKALKGSPYRGKLPVKHPPVHWGCRCLWIPVLDDEDLADDLEGDDWIRSQPEPVQIDILGKGVHEIWKSGVPLTDMLTDRGQMMTVAELRSEFEKEAKAA